MRTTIRRKMIETTICSCSVEMKDGEPVLQKLEPVVVYGKVKPADAEKFVRWKHDCKNGITITGIDSKEVMFEISVADFIEHATRVSGPDENQ